MESTPASPDTLSTPRLSILYQLHVLSRLAQSVVERALEWHEMTGSEFAVYSLVKAQGPVTVSEVADWSGTPLPSVSKMLARLEQRGHLARVSNPDDGRSTLVSLTSSGEEAHAAARTDFVEALEHVKSHLGDALDDVRWALGRYDAAMRAALGEPPKAFPSGRPDYSLSYAGSPLTKPEEEEARWFIEWLHWRRGRT